MARTTSKTPKAAGANGAPDHRDLSAPLDVLLTEATYSPRQRFFAADATLRLGASLARRPVKVARRVTGLGRELGRVAAGAAEVSPPRGDRRFSDPAWNENPVFRRLMQGYLAMGETADRLISDAELDLETERRVRFPIENLRDALAPTNFLWSNPAAIKAARSTRGMSLVRGAQQLASDMRTPPRLPSMVDTSEFELGRNLAATPGAMIYREDAFELIQYAPQTDQVRSAPLLLVPPMINKFYVADISPGRSLVEYLVRQGQQVFAISWRNPEAEHGSWGLDTYCDAILAALDAACEVGRSEQAQLLAFCGGGIAGACVAGNLVARGKQDRLAGLTLGVCVLDNEQAGAASAFVNRDVARAALAASARKGYLKGTALAELFAWLRPNDLIWSYVVNNYLLGRRPPAFDILFWNQDTVRLPAGLHRDFIQIALDNPLVESGGLELLDTPIDLGQVTVDSYVVAGVTDHITPWENCQRTTRMLGGDVRFALSTSGHIAAIVNPPGNEKASYRIAEQGDHQDPKRWLAEAEKRPGSWWEDWNDWLGERSGPMHDAPAELGNDKFKPRGRAPGTYVLAN
ncbi:MAG: PHA/PHB synthase family protein [Solirubrobacterales bacterium]